MDVVIVESPAKAKTINKYLGSNYVVLPSYGHVRDLPSKDGSVRPEEDFAMTYELDPKSAKQVKAIAEALKDADHLYLATDPDREGEAISWHVLEALMERRAIRDVDVKRIVFNEITKQAVLNAMRHPRELDMNLVNAQQARRALDYLVGFTLSPVLWRKLPGARSAGRVQSVALRLICDRELEIETFKREEYWTVDVEFRSSAGEPFTARLTSLEGRKLKKFDLADERAALDAVERINRRDFTVADVATKPGRRNPQPPFITSTLQQEASRKLGFSAKRTMQLAQRLYEGVAIGGETIGLITYMRTDGVQMANEAIGAIRGVIGADYGDRFVPEQPRIYKSKAKNAQEAHEAIRPTDVARRPDDARGYLDNDMARLYDLIWKRAVASQMASAEVERTTVDIAAADGAVGLRASGTVIVFPGFLKVYEEGHDDEADDQNGGRLPKLARGEALQKQNVRPEQHFTEPPPRYTEASLVKKLEELGIGRPSTYAQILSVLQERDYAHLEKNRFVPSDKGRLVTAFLTSFFTRYVGYDFTADLEQKLDEVSANKVNWKDVLRDFWREFTALVAETKELRVADVLEALNEALGPHIFPPRDDGIDARACPSCGDGRLSLKLGRFGAFIGCSNYPDCRFTRRIGTNGEQASDVAPLDGPKELGEDPDTGMPITLRHGPYGNYVQLGEAAGEEKPRRASLPKDVPVEAVDLALALRLLALPRTVGEHPETGKPITAGIGRYGPFVASDGKYARLGSSGEVFEIGLNRAVALLADSKKGGRARSAPAPLRVLGPHPDDGMEIQVMKGRYGPYVKHGKINATLPAALSPEEVTLEQAVELIREKAAKGRGRAAGGKKKKTGTTKKKATKKSTAGSKG